MTDEEEKDAARTKFADAINVLLEEYGYDDGGLLSDWHLIVVQTNVHDDGSTGSTYSRFVPKHCAVHSVAGMLRYATIKNDDHIRHPNED